MDNLKIIDTINYLLKSFNNQSFIILIMDLKTYSDLERILTLYHLHEFNGDFSISGPGLWKPTPLPVVFGEVEIFDIWQTLDRKKHEGRILLAGSGDGRRGAFLNRLGYDVFEVELNDKLIEHSEYLAGLHKKGL